MTLPDSVTTIGDDAFSYCESLTSVTIPDSVTTIGYSAFYSCNSLIYNVYDNAKYLGNSMNPYLVLVDVTSENITSCNIHSDTKVINHSAFDSCKSLTSVTIPDSVTTIGSSAFYSCTSLTSVTIPDSVTTIGGFAFYECHSLTSVTLPDSVTTIGDFAFRYCSSLTSVTITDSVTTIGECAFQYCSSLTEIVLPKGMDIIMSYAFDGCYNLSTVYHKGTQADWDWIIILSGNDYLKNANIIHNYTGCAHSYDNGVETKAPTCKETGVKTFTCTVCGDSYTEELAKLTDHSYADGVCTVCGGEDPTYVPPTEPTEPPTDPSEPTDPTEPGVDTPTEPNEDKEEGGFFAAIAAFFEAIFRILFFFLYL